MDWLSVVIVVFCSLARHPEISAAFQQSRMARDGAHFHITLDRVDLKNHPNFADSNMDPEQVFQQRLSKWQNVPNNWRCLGVGSVTENSNQAWYCVVDWPDANTLRQSLGLPPSDFHITLGYRYSDIHGVRKDESTLLRIR